MDDLGAGEQKLVRRVSDARLPAWSIRFLIKPPAQAATNVAIERHGHFMVVEFDQRYATDRPKSLSRPSGARSRSAAAG